MKTANALRRFYARHITARAGVEDPRIADAFAAIERERFVGRGPWQIPVPNGYISTETDDPSVLYQDIVVGLMPDKGINNGEPSLHAKCLAAADPRAGDVILHIGAGTGYYTAILAHLAGETGRVHAYELEPTLARRAAANLAACGSVTVREETAVGARLPVANVIYVSAGVTHVPAQWLDALARGGRLVLPLTPTGRLGCVVLVTRHSETAFGARVLSPAAFIACTGAHDEAQSQVLAAAFDKRFPDDVRSLRRGHQPDETAWCVGEGWWLSTADPS